MEVARAGCPRNSAVFRQLGSDPINPKGQSSFQPFTRKHRYSCRTSTTSPLENVPHFHNPLYANASLCELSVIMSSLARLKIELLCPHSLDQLRPEFLGFDWSDKFHSGEDLTLCNFACLDAAAV